MKLELEYSLDMQCWGYLDNVCMLEVIVIRTLEKNV
jgi:hypothetical protein